MTTLKITIFAFAILLLMSCESNSTNRTSNMAAAYHNKLDNMFSPTVRYLNAFLSKIEIALLTHKSSEVHYLSNKAIALIDEANDKINNTETPQIERAEDLKKGTLNLLKWYKLLFQKYKAGADANGSKAIQKVMLATDSCMENIQKAQSMFKAMNEDFAIKNGCQTY
jgi:hypothetical protein